jgi:hypothetical protein
MGGMGVVYAGVDASGVRAAVKLIHPAHAGDGEFVARFAREIGVLRRVGGLCTAKVLGSDIGSDTPWVATEYVSGPTLERWVQDDGPLSGDKLYGVAAGLAEALTAMHAAGVVHRDLKPSNVILSPAGPRVVDFGIARVLDHTSLTRTGTVIGSPGWVSPEEYRGEEGGTAADVHGWGLLVCFAATGRPPYGRGRPEVLVHRALNEAPDTSAVPTELRETVDRALSKDPGSRPLASGLLGTVTGQWCTLREEPPSAAVADVTRLLTRTWIAHAAPEPAWTPPPGTPHAEQRVPPPVTPHAEPHVAPPPAPHVGHGVATPAATSRGLWARVGFVSLVVALVVAIVLILQPWRKSAVEIAELAAERAHSVYALRFTSRDFELTITANRFATGKITRSGSEIQLLKVPAKGYLQQLLYKAPATYWADHSEALPSGVGWGGLDDYFGNWISTPYLAGADNPGGLPALFRNMEIGGYHEGLRGPVPPGTTDTTVGDRPAVKIPYGNDSYYVSRAEPHEIIRFESETESYDVTEITGDDATALAAALRNEVTELRKKSLATYMVMTPVGTAGPCTASECSSAWSFYPGVGGDSGTGVVHLYETLGGGTAGERLGTCRTPLDLRDNPAKDTCEISGWKWRSWFNGSPGGDYQWHAYLLQRAFTDDEIATFLKELENP